MITIAPLARAEAGRAAALLADAFAEDALMAEYLPRAGDRRQRLRQLFTATLHDIGLHRQTVDAAHDDGGRLLGVALWEHEPRRWSVPRRLAQAPRYVAALRITGLAAHLRHQAALTAYRPGGPHWYLADIAVAPPAQGGGVGTALLRHRLAIVDRHPQPACLEATTTGSERLYRRLGFRAHGVIAGFATVRPVAMIRPPAYR